SPWFFFFFQAEDGIRDFHVTGVQTCALPICSTSIPRSSTRWCAPISGDRPACCFSPRSGRRPASSAGASPARSSRDARARRSTRSEEHTSELQSRENLVCRLLLEKKKKEVIK